MPGCPRFATAAVAAAVLAAWLPAQTGQPGAATRTIEGRVVDQRGEGVPAARVQARTTKDRTVLASTVADGEGYFRLPKVPAQMVEVRASADGFCTGTALAGATAETVAVEMQHSATLRGVLRRKDGSPAAGVTVHADPTGRALTYVVAEAGTAADGTFELRDVPLAHVLVSAWIDGEGLHEARTRVTGDTEVALAPFAGPTTRIDVRVEGLPEGLDPPPGFSLFPYRDGSLMRFPPPHHRGQLDARGTWSLAPAPDCDYTLRPGLAGFAFAPDEVRLQQGKGPHGVRFTATALGSQSLQCRARVVDGDGKPVAGLPFVMRTVGGAGPSEATSGADGELTFASALAAGTGVVIFTTDVRWVVDQPKAGMVWESDRRFLDDFETKVDPSATLELKVIPAGSVEGRLQLADGRPAPFVRLELQTSRANVMPRWGQMAFATSRRDGTFRFTRLHHLADELRVEVSSSAGSLTVEGLHLAEPGKSLALGDLKLAPPAVIDGVVRDANQRPAPGVAVWLRDWDMATGNQRSGSVTEVTTDRDGRYRFVGVPPGGAYLQLLPDGDHRGGGDRAVEPFEVEAGKTYTHDLQLR